MVDIRKKPKMPPKMPKVSKKSVFKKFKIPVKRSVCREYLCHGGPWHNKIVAVQLTGSDCTMVFKIGQNVGRYRYDCCSLGLRWEHVQIK